MNKKLSLILKSAVIALALVFAACSQAIQPGDDAFASNALSLSRLPSRVGVDPTMWDAFIPLPFTGNTDITAVNGLATDGAFLVAAGIDTETDIPYASRYDTVTGLWSNPVSLATYGLNLKPGAAHYVYNNFLITGGTTTNNGVYSPNGQKWLETGTIGFGTKAAVYGSHEELYVVAGQNGQAAYTSDLGLPFVTIPNTTTGWIGTGGRYYINAGAYGDKTYVFGGGSGRIAWTNSVRDPSTWTPGTIDGSIFTATGFINAMAFGAGVFVAAGNDNNNAGVIAYSIDNGQHWLTPTSIGNLANATIYALTYGNGYFVAVNDEGDVGFSTDGELWHNAQYASGNVYSDDEPQVNAVVYYEATDTFVSGGGNSDGLKMAASVNPPTVR
jgi:hypothetical protein